LRQLAKRHADWLRDIRYQGQSGKHLLALSFSVFDPTRTYRNRKST